MIFIGAYDLMAQLVVTGVTPAWQGSGDIQREVGFRLEHAKSKLKISGHREQWKLARAVVILHLDASVFADCRRYP